MAAEDWESHMVEERQAPPRWYQLGVQVELQTTNDERLSGTVFAAAEQCVVLQQPGSTPFHSNVVLLKESAVARVISITTPVQPMELRLPVVDERRGRERLKKAVAAAEAEAAKIGEGVSAEAQAIFDALAKTLPCRWDARNIVVLEEIVISEPYGPDNCMALVRDDAAMARVKKVLVAERQRLNMH